MATTNIPPFGCDVRGASAEQKREFFNLLIEASNRKTAILGDSNYYGIDTSGDWNVISSNDYAMEIFTQIIPIEQGIAILKGEEEPKTERFIKPTDKQLIEFAILFNDGVVDHKKLADMVGYAEFLIDRLHENGDVLIKSSKEIESANPPKQ
jgi:hypothetical protein